MRKQDKSRHLGLVLAAGLIWMPVWSSRADNAIAASGSPAILQLDSVVPLPPSHRRGLVVTVLGFEPPASGMVDAVVTVRDDGAPATEVGRFSLYPATAFEARSEDETQRFLFDITSVVPTSGAGSWSAEISLEPLRQDQPTTGARMRFGPARLILLR